MRNARTEELAALPYLTPEYIRAHHARLERMGKGREIGLLIYILEPMPRSRHRHPTLGAKHSPLKDPKDFPLTAIERGKHHH